MFDRLFTYGSTRSYLSLCVIVLAGPMLNLPLGLWQADVVSAAFVVVHVATS